REVPTLVLDDRVQKLEQLGMPSLRDQTVVGRERRELVGGTPGHVQRNEVAHHGGSEHRADVAQPSLSAESPADPLAPRQPRRGGGSGAPPFGVPREKPTRPP